MSLSVHQSLSASKESSFGIKKRKRDIDNMKTRPIQTAQIAQDALGLPFSPHFGDRYHAQIGPQQQAQHVFIEGHGLPQRWQGRDRFVVLETGFGLGYNFLATWAAWRADEKRCRVLAFLSLEAHPLTLLDLKALHQNSPWPELSQALTDAWPPLTPNWHVLHFEGGRVRLILALGDVAACLPQIRACVDAFDLDGFAPAHNPEMWQARLFKQMARLAAPQATVATWSSASTVREGLRSAGFEVRKAPGVGGKLHITLGGYAPSFTPRRAASVVAHQRPSSFISTGIGKTGKANDERRAIIVGAGLAGCSAAWGLARQGWQTAVWDRHANCAQAASGNAVGLFHGVVHTQDSMHARALRAAALQAQVVFKQAMNDGVTGDLQGLLRLISPTQDLKNEAPSDHDKTVKSWQTCLVDQGLPAEFAQVLNSIQASALAGCTLQHPAWFFPGGGWINPAELARWFLKIAGDYTQFCGEKAVARLEKTPYGWALFDEKDQLLGQAPCVVLANALDAKRLWATLHGESDASDAYLNQGLRKAFPARRIDDTVRMYGEEITTTLGTFCVSSVNQINEAWPMEAVRGQISRISTAHLPPELRALQPKLPIAGAGYLIPCGPQASSTRTDPPIDEQAPAWFFGATAQIGDLDPQVRQSDHASNWAGLMDLLGINVIKRPGGPLTLPHLQGRTQWRAVSRDRLPLIGGVPQKCTPDEQRPPDQARFVPREPGLFAYTALGSRGITWAALGGQILAAWVSGAPAPVEADLWDALDPARFRVRATRKSS
jgi:tRNA 5-methylaminomethyl-2-thiouridine biosynthesis bifunctional protein